MAGVVKVISPSTMTCSTLFNGTRTTRPLWRLTRSDGYWTRNDSPSNLTTLYGSVKYNVAITISTSSTTSGVVIDHPPTLYYPGAAVLHLAGITAEANNRDIWRACQLVAAISRQQQFV